MPLIFHADMKEINADNLCADGLGDIEDIADLDGADSIFGRPSADVSDVKHGRKAHKVLKRTAKNERKVKKLAMEVSENTNDPCSATCLSIGSSYTAAPYNSVVPGTEAVYIKTWGCSHNSSDSEYMAGLLATYGYRVTMDEKLRDQAHLWLLNSCTVKAPAESQFRLAVEQAQKAKKHVVVAGCVPQGASRTPYINGISVIGVQQIDRVVEVVEETLKGHTVRLLGQRRVGTRKAGGAPLMLPKVRKNPLIEIIAISTGCLNACTYCKTKHARGNLGSYPVAEIIQRAQQAFEEGVRELWITSEDTGAYGRDIGTNLPEMLQALIAVIPNGCKLRLGMTNPPYILDHLQEIAEILQHPRVYAFIHIPVQAGSNSVLFDMKREYTCADFERVCDTLIRLVPHVYIATDVICGFPTESDEDFEETLALVRKYKFPSLFINQFYPRPGTAAASMRPQVLSQDKKARSKAASEIFNSYTRYAERNGDEVKVLVTELASDGLHYVGHTDSYEQVLIAPLPRYMGSTLRVRITDYGKHFMKADGIEELILFRGYEYKDQLKPAVSFAADGLSAAKQPPGRHTFFITQTNVFDLFSLKNVRLMWQFLCSGDRLRPLMGLSLGVILLAVMSLVCMPVFL